MSFFRSLLLLCLVSLFTALGLLAVGSAVGYGEYRGGYAVISSGVSVEDRAIRELLDAGKNNFAGSPVSESSQWVILDEFGSLEVIPLDKYSARLSSFDPRNDGYAGKLKNVFVRDDRRFVYIPLKTDNASPSLLNKQFKDLLGDIPFSVDYFGIGQPLSLFFITFAAASLALLIICYAKKNIHPGAANIIALLPALSSLAFFGAPGIASAALFLGLAVMLREPLNELVMLLRLPSDGSAQRLKLIYKNAVEPYWLYWFSLPLFAAVMGVLVFFTELKLLFVLLVFAVVCIVFFFSIRTLSLLGGKHRRFTPVLIIRRKFVDFSFSMYMLPFTAAAFLIVLLTPYMSGAVISDSKFDALIDEGDYYAHLTYQAAFSMRQLGKSDAGYPSYILDEDGLPSPVMNSGAVPVIKIDEYPPFPLKHLMEFFNSVNASVKMDGAGNNDKGGIAGNLPLLLLLLFIFPGFFLNGKISFPSKDNFAGLKRFSGKLRRTDIRRKTLLYKNKNNLRILKDA